MLHRYARRQVILIGRSFLSFRLLNRTLAVSKWKSCNPNFFIPSRITCDIPCPPTVINIKGVKANMAAANREKDHDKINMKIGRPMSPHVNIYRNELHSVLSIAHRMAGVVSGVYVAMLGLQAFILPCQIEYYICSLQDLGLGMLGIATMKFVISFPFIYHYCNGARHLVWDATAKFLTMKKVYMTAYVTLCCTFFLTSVAAFV
ncbi:hypothetical protein FQR65_LT05610 [Abscondita terminalis]|nr:hypothetical protein FQR65_LT05610 [Abscondita terminalis]